jgi:hypothetical protein
MDSRTEFQIVMGALELGIIPPNRAIDETLAKMNPTERRQCKRKYRKIVRRQWRTEANSFFAQRKWEEYSPARRRMTALNCCNRVGLAIVEQPVEE